MSKAGVLKRAVVISCLMTGALLPAAPAGLGQSSEEPPEEPVLISSVGSGGTDLLDIHGENFDKGNPDAPQVFINDIEVPESGIISWTANMIVINTDGEYDWEPTYNELQVCVTIPPRTTPEGASEEGYECDDFCLNIFPAPHECDFNDLARPVAVDRVVRWLIPNDPEEETFHQYDYKFGPAMQGYGKHIFGDPLYYQLLDDYSINLKLYLNRFEENPYGIDLIDRCENYLPELKGRLEELEGEWSDNEPEPGGGYLSIKNGILTVREGYRWDGPSLEIFNYRTWAKPAALMRATVVHDALYDLMRLHDIEHYWVRVVGSEAYKNRKLADCMFFMLTTQDHYKRSKAKSNFSFIRLGGASKTKEDLPFWKFHAVADAGEYESRECADDRGTEVVLDGRGSRHAISWEWEVENRATGDLLHATGEMVPVTLEPGTHSVKLTVDDGNDGEEHELYRDTDAAIIELTPDTAPPVFLLAEDRNVSNDPGLCSAVVDLNIIAADDCGAPLVNCINLSTGAALPIGVPVEFPVGTTQVVCTATDVGDNQAVEDVLITVNDVEAPVIHGIDQPLYMWPPNHEYRTFHTSDFVTSVEDNCVGPTLHDVLIRKAASDEPENGQGDGNTLNDIVIASDGRSVMLRSETRGGGNGRVYTVHHEVADASGNLTTEPFQVHAVNEKNGQSIDDGVAYTVEYQPSTEEQVGEETGGEEEEQREEEAGSKKDEDLDHRLQDKKNNRTRGGSRGRW